MPSLALALIAISILPFALYFALKRPLIFPFGLYVMMVPFDQVIGQTAEAKVAMIIAGLSAGALLLNMLVTRRVLAPPTSWTTWAVYTLAATLTALWTIDPNSTVNSVATLLSLFAFFTILSIFPAERQDVRIVGGIIVTSGVVAAAYGTLCYFQGLRTHEDRLTIAGNGLQIDPNHIAAALLLPLALAIGTLLESRDVRLRLASAIGTTIMVAALFLTGSRGGLIALAVMLLYIAWRTRYRFQILAIMTLAGVGSLLQPTMWDRFADKGLGAGSGRLYIWDAGRLALKDHWLGGAGLGAFPAAYNHELLAMYQPIFQGWSRPAHNAVLSAAVELGLLGALLLIFAWWRSWQDARGNTVIEAAIVGLAVAAMFLDVMLFKYIWLALSMAVLVKNAAEPRFLRGMRRQPAPAAAPARVVRAVSWRTR